MIKTIFLIFILFFTGCLSNDELYKGSDSFPSTNFNGNNEKNQSDSELLDDEEVIDLPFGTEIGNPIPKPKVQKGPFILDSSIIIQELNLKLQPQGKVFFVRTNDDLGQFDFPPDLTSGPLEVSANGFYFNEVTGELSKANINLGSYINLSEENIANINILTTLAQKRIRILVNEGLSFNEAKRQAEDEVLKVFHINIDEILSFSEMDITQDGQANAILLAISIILQGDREVNELSQFLANLSRDISDNGLVDDKRLIDEICLSSSKLDLVQIRKNLFEYLSRITNNFSIPPFEDYIDRNCDGKINLISPDSYEMIELPFLFPEQSVTLSYQNKVYAFGEMQENDYLQKVVVSEDLKNWQEFDLSGEGNFYITPKTKILVYQDEFLAVNYNQERKKIEFWKSRNGINWNFYEVNYDFLVENITSKIIHLGDVLLFQIEDEFVPVNTPDYYRLEGNQFNFVTIENNNILKSATDIIFFKTKYYASIRNLEASSTETDILGSIYVSDDLMTWREHSFIENRVRSPDMIEKLSAFQVVRNELWFFDRGKDVYRLSENRWIKFDLNLSEGRDFSPNTYEYKGMVLIDYRNHHPYLLGRYNLVKEYWD